MHHKLILIFVVLVLIPMITLSILTFRNYTNAMELNTAQYVSQVSEEVLKRVSTFTKDIQRLTRVPFYLDDLQQALVMKGNERARVETIEKYTNLILEMQEGINAVLIADNDDQLFYSASDPYIGIWDQYAQWTRAAKEAGGKAAIFGAQLVQEQRQTRYSLTVVREILDLGYFERRGMIVIQADLSVLESSFRDLDRKTNGKTLLLDDDNRVLFDSEGKLQARMLQDEDIQAHIDEGNNTFDWEQDGVEFICIVNRAEDSGLKVLVFVEKNELLSQTLKERNWNVTMTILVGLIALGCSIIVSLAVTRPLRRLYRLMKRVEKGDLHVRSAIASRDEIGMVGLQFNQMLDTIQRLIQDIYEMTNRKKEFELEALQSQINPHFIYNTLELIRFRAELNEDRDVSQMVVKLGKLLRYSIIRGEPLVTVQDELDHISHYLDIQNERFKHQLQLDIDIQPSLYHLEMMKLTFQPIVENAVVHGYEKMQRTGTIRISARLAAASCLFCISDDGLGMSEERLQSLRKRLSDEHADDVKGERRGFGLRNVHERIRLQYGDEYGIEIDSIPESGTKVYIRLPCDEEELVGC